MISKSNNEYTCTYLFSLQEYVELYSIARDFIGHIRQMAGKEPVDGSHGDMQLLPKYVVSGL